MEVSDYPDLWEGRLSEHFPLLRSRGLQIPAASTSNYFLRYLSSAGSQLSLVHTLLSCAMQVSPDKKTCALCLPEFPLSKVTVLGCYSVLESNCFTYTVVALPESFYHHKQRLTARKGVIFLIFCSIYQQWHNNSTLLCIFKDVLIFTF